MKITELKPHCRQAVQEIYAQAFPERERKDFALLQTDRYRLLAAEENGEPLGFAALAGGGDSVLLDYLAVKDGLRGRGIGDKLLNFAVQAAGGGEVFLEIENPGCAADGEERSLRERRRKFYGRHGFSEAGLRVSLNGVDMLVMSLGRAPAARTAYLKLYETAFAGLKDERCRTRIIEIYRP